MITQEVLLALRDGKEVQFKGEGDVWLSWKFDDGEWMYRENGKWGVSNVSSIPWLTRTLLDAEWRLPAAEQRDWVGALEWLKGGKTVLRSGATNPGIVLDVRKAGLIYGGTAIPVTIELADYEATDWVEVVG